MDGLADDRYWVGPSTSPDTYQLVSPIGGGGEGEVWRAVVPLSDSGRGLVAIKIMPPQVTDDQDSWSRYSHLLKSLDHPGLVRVIEVFLGATKHRAGTVEATEVDTTGVPAIPGMYRYVVMKLVEGVTLREWLDDTVDAPISRRLRALMMVASALDEMHSGRQTGVPVAHGDVKPSNIIMREDGSTVLVDLGLTRIADGRGRPGRSRPYAAPELFLPGAVTTPEADRFAFTATLISAVTGETPPISEGRGVDVEAVARLLADNPMTARRPLLRNGVVAALQAAPEGRPAPLSTWLASLADTLSQTTQPFDPSAAESTRPARSGRSGRRLRRGLIGAAVVVLLAAGSVIGYEMSAGGASPGRTSGGQTKALSSATPGSSPSAADVSPSVAVSPSVTALPSDTLSPSAGVDGSTDPSSEPTIEPGADYFADGSKFRPTDSSGFSTGTATVNGTFHTQNLQFYTDYAGTRDYATFVLSRRYSRLKATIGIGDDAHSSQRVRFQIVADNKTVFQQDMSKGAAADLDVVVSNVYSVTFSITELAGNGGYGIFAEARVVP